MVNNVVLQGRFTKDPEIRYTSNQTPVVAFSLAVERDFKSADGERQADFITCVAWKQTAEFLSKWFHKGDMTVVTGRLQVRNYEDKQGNKREAVEVVAERVNFCANTHGNAEASIPAKFTEETDESPLPF